MKNMQNFLLLKPSTDSNADAHGKRRRDRLVETMHRARARLPGEGGSYHGTAAEGDSEGEEDQEEREDRVKQLESKLRDDSQAVLTRRATDEANAADLDDVAVAMAQEADDDVDSDDRGWGEYDRLVYYRVR